MTTVEVTTLADGLVVRLAGVLGTAVAPALRRALLSPRPAACRDVLVDAGAVDSIDREPLSVLTTASRHAGDSGGRFAFTRLSTELALAASAVGVLDQLTLLGPPGARRTP